MIPTAIPQATPCRIAMLPGCMTLCAVVSRMPEPRVTPRSSERLFSRRVSSSAGSSGLVMKWLPPSP
jgi:hypothetical protein